ncbi:hypothetical protein RYX36_022853 [Vicia faba]
MEARGIPTKSSHKDCQNQRAFVVGCWSCSEANDGWVRLVVGGDVVPLWWSMEGCITESGTNLRLEGCGWSIVHRSGVTGGLGSMLCGESRMMEMESVMVDYGNDERYSCEVRRDLKRGTGEVTGQLSEGGKCIAEIVDMVGGVILCMLVVRGERVKIEDEGVCLGS